MNQSEKTQLRKNIIATLERLDQTIFAASEKTPDAALMHLGRILGCILIALDSADDTMLAQLSDVCTDWIVWSAAPAGASASLDLCFSVTAAQLN
jgi:hypothetical protein